MQFEEASEDITVNLSVPEKLARVPNPTSGAGILSRRCDERPVFGKHRPERPETLRIAARAHEYRKNRWSKGRNVLGSDWYALHAKECKTDNGAP